MPGIANVLETVVRTRRQLELLDGVTVPVDTAKQARLFGPVSIAFDRKENRSIFSRLWRYSPLAIAYEFDGRSV